jgi:hypothetical protein
VINERDGDVEEQIRRKREAEALTDDDQIAVLRHL